MISLPALLGILNKTTSGYFPYVKSTKNTARYASLMLGPGQARLFEKRGIMYITLAWYTMLTI